MKQKLEKDNIMKKNNGFTLIELLAVIVILAIIALIAVPTVMNIINKANKSAFKDSAYGIIKAGELFYTNGLLNEEEIVEDKVFIFPDDNGSLELKGSKPTGGSMIVRKDGKISIAITNGKHCIKKHYEEDDVTINEDLENCIIPISITDIILAEEKITIFEEKSKTIELAILPNNATNKTLNYSSGDESVVTIENGVITGISAGTTTVTISTTDGSNISKQIEIIVEKEPIMASTNSCIQKGNICSKEEIKAGVLVNVKVNKTVNYDFYVVSNTEDEVTLIMDRNLGGKVSWINGVDYNDNDNWGSYGNNNKGPITALNYLNKKTVDWKNIPAIEEYINFNTSGGSGYQKFEIKNGIGKLTNKDGTIETEIKGETKARLLTYVEATTLGCTIYAGSCPIWIYENLSSSNTEEMPMGHLILTNTPTQASYQCSSIRFNGAVGSNNYVWMTDTGVRPVITLLK